MALSHRLHYIVTIECTPNGPIEVPPWIYGEGDVSSSAPSSWTLEQRIEANASELIIRFTRAAQFGHPWRLANHLAPGSLIVLKFDGLPRFTGRVREHVFTYNATEETVQVVCVDKMGMLQDAVVDINVLRATIRESRFLMTRLADDTGPVTSIADGGGGTVDITSVAHELQDGYTVVITGTASYNGTYSITWIDDDTFSIVHSWDGDEAGTWTFTSPNDFAFEAIDKTGSPHVYFRPWKTSDPGSDNFLVPVWYKEGEGDDVLWHNIPFAEYNIHYERGAIVFRNDVIQTIGGETFTLDEIAASLYADFVYFDPDDTTTTRVSDIFRLAFETPEAIGGLGWTEDDEYEIVDETPADILSGMKWDTNRGDGDAQSFVSNLYENPYIGLAPSYWVRDFNGNGLVQAKLVLQDPTWPKDVNVVYDTRTDSPINNIYTRVVMVNTVGTRENLARNKAQFTDIFTDPLGKTYHETGKMPEDDASDQLGYLCDEESASSWGYFRCGNNSEYLSKNDAIPYDTPLFQVDLSEGEEELKLVDIIHVNQGYTFQPYGDQPYPYDPTTGSGAMNGIYKLFEQQRFTVEYNTDTSDTPDADSWHPIHPSLFHASIAVDTQTESTGITIEGINTWARWLRVIINMPYWVRISNSPKHYHMIMFWLSEFQVFGGGYVVDPITGELPEVKFTDNDEDEFRCMCDLDGDLVDLYRPTLLTMTEAMGLKYRTLVLENDDVWDFDVKIDDDCDNVSQGYKYLTTMLDSNSKENDWSVNIDVRPDVMIGSTVFSSLLNPNKTFLVMGNVINNISGNMKQTLTLTDVQSPVIEPDSSEGEGCEE